jgi:hypothetical protein
LIEYLEGIVMKTIRTLLIIILVIAVLYFMGTAFLMAIQGGHP